MTAAPSIGPSLAVVAPFFVAAPLGLIAGGVLLAGAGEDALLAVNAPRLVAVTHAVVLGWLTLSIMGAIYQLGPAVLGGRLRSESLARVQFWVHVVSVAFLALAFAAWDVAVISLAGVGVAVSFILFLVNAFPAVAAFRPGSLPRMYVSFALVFLIAVGAVGITYAGTLEHLWFPVTLGRLSGHAHLGLAGWLGLMLMGISYQVVPMFNVVHERKPRFGLVALVLTVVATAVGSVWLMTDPSRAVRVAIALGLAVGPVLWAVDILRLLGARSRRHLDIQGRATFLSIVFLAAAVVAGLLAAIGEPVAPGGEPARLHLAYGALGVGGWAGLTLIGNSYKILPFLVWYHRYRQLAGSRPVPLVADLYNARLAHAVLAGHAVAVAIVAVGALAGELGIVRAGGGILALSGGLHFANLLWIVARRSVAAPSRSAPRLVFR